MVHGESSIFIATVLQSRHFMERRQTKKLIKHLTYAFQSGIKRTCMALRLEVATTEATATTPNARPISHNRQRLGALVN
jgi:hypothetical protein